MGGFDWKQIYSLVRDMRKSIRKCVIWYYTVNLAMRKSSLCCVYEFFLYYHNAFVVKVELNLQNVQIRFNAAVPGIYMKLLEGKRG